MPPPWLFVIAACRVAKLEVDAHKSGEPFTYRVLLLVLWALHPFANITCTRDEFPFLAALVSHSRVRFYDVVAANKTAASYLALFLAVPHALPAVCCCWWGRVVSCFAYALWLWLLGRR